MDSFSVKIQIALLAGRQMFELAFNGKLSSKKHNKKGRLTSKTFLADHERIYSFALFNHRQKENLNLKKMTCRRKKDDDGQRDYFNKTKRRAEGNQIH
jgi:hypothetical protein